MEALNGMTLLETLEDETAMDDLDDILLSDRTSPDTRPRFQASPDKRQRYPNDLEETKQRSIP